MSILIFTQLPSHQLKRIAEGFLILLITNSLILSTLRCYIIICISSQCQDLSSEFQKYQHFLYIFFHFSTILTWHSSLLNPLQKPNRYLEATTSKRGWIWFSMHLSINFQIFCYADLPVVLPWSFKTFDAWA